MKTASVSTYFVTSFYHFFPLTDLDKVSAEIEAVREQWQISGLIILGTEGINASISSPSQLGLQSFKDWLGQHFQIEINNFKDSQSQIPPFLRLRIKIRPEIVTLKTPELKPGQKNHHLSPAEWNRVLKEEKDAAVIDTRNWYEYKIGTFKGAINPNIEQFTEFPKFMESQNIRKDQKVLIFCTGGIRCEKGILELQRQGYNNVYQLDGGILKYIEEHPNDQFEGECFVFDQRVAVNQELKPTENYKLCPYCGQPAKTIKQCKRCDSDFRICEICGEDLDKAETCSKNCNYHLKLHPNRKGKKQLRWYDGQ